MAKKKTNEIIEEQRRARQEFLKLKKMQRGEITPEPKPSEQAILPKTPKEKLKNIWYHDKYLILGAIAACIIIAVLVAQCCSKVDPDLQIVVFTYTPVSDTSCNLIADYSEQFCEDINGDGKTSVQVVNCSFNAQSGDQQYRYTIMQKLQAMIAANGDTLLYITDEESLKYFTESDGALENCFEGEALPLNEEFYAACNPKETDDVLVFALPEKLSISCRQTNAQAFRRVKNLEEIVKYSKKIMTELTN